MIINDDLIKQWEPQVQKMLIDIYIVGMVREEIAQELRIAVLKAAKSFDDSTPIEGSNIKKPLFKVTMANGSIKILTFHTYLYRTLLNTIATLMSKGGRQPKLTFRSLDEVYENTNTADNKTLDALQDPSNDAEIIETMDLLTTHNLSINEKEFVILRLEGLTMEEISENLGESAYKVRHSLREKFVDLANEHQIDF